ncbi:MAG: SRPBCC family protein [Janthinobacterium lividum]
MSHDCVHDTAWVQAPIDRVWALSRRVELVKETLGMNLAGGQTTGFVEAGSRVVWSGWKFGLPTKHHTLITGYAAPHAAIADPRAEPTLGPELHAEHPGQRVAWFQDSQERGRFAFFQHDHWMREQTAANGEPQTLLEDEVHFRLPFGVLGRLAARFLMEPYIRRLVKRRFGRLKALAEGEGWRQWM